MADGDGPKCVTCKSTSSLMWQRNESGATICLDCHSQDKKNRASRSPQRSGSSAPSENSNSSTSSVTNHSNQTQSEKSPVKPTTTVTTRRTTRARERNNRAKQQQTQSAPPVSTSTPPSPAPSTNGVTNTSSSSSSSSSSKSLTEKANTKAVNGERENGEEYHQKSRRSLQLKQGAPMKAPSSEAMIVTSDSIIHKGTTYEVGDIVSLLDRDGGIYFAVIRGFMQDQYAEKYAVLTWLLPMYPNPTHFDPAAFILGPEEDTPRSMEVIEFVCHSPQSRHFQTSYFHNLEQAELWNH